MIKKRELSEIMKPSLSYLGVQQQLPESKHRQMDWKVGQGGRSQPITNTYRSQRADSFRTPMRKFEIHLNNWMEAKLDWSLQNLHCMAHLNRISAMLAKV